MLGKWPKWFFVASLIHGIGAATWSGLFLLDGIGFTLNLSRIIAGGGVGTWFTVGYMLYIITGFLGMVAQGVLYHVAANGGEVYSEKLAATHMVLMNIAIVGATWMLGFAGFTGGSLTLAGRIAEIHGAIVVYVSPIGYCILIGIVAAIIGTYNIFMTLRK